MAFFLEGRSWPFTSPLHLLRFGPLSPVNRVRMGLAVLKLQKYWPPVGRVDNVYGDRNLVCACPPVSEYDGVEPAGA